MKKLFKKIAIFGFIGLSLNLLADGKHEGHHQPPVVEGYLNMQSKLAADKLLNKEDIKEFKAKALLTKNSELMGAIDGLESQSDITGQREAFKAVSTHLISYAKKEKIDGLYEAHCPMASASWLQLSEEVKNPYYGTKMLSCGSVEKI